MLDHVTSMKNVEQFGAVHSQLKRNSAEEWCVIAWNGYGVGGVYKYGDNPCTQTFPSICETD